MRSLQTSSGNFRSAPENKSRTGRGRPTYSTCETDQTIGGLNGRAGLPSGSDAILRSGIAAFRTGAMASATLLGTTAMVGCAHKAEHSPLEQQRSQFAPCRMLLQGTSTGAYAKIGPWRVRARSNTATMVRGTTIRTVSRDARRSDPNGKHQQIIRRTSGATRAGVIRCSCLSESPSARQPAAENLVPDCADLHITKFDCCGAINFASCDAREARTEALRLFRL